ncbi:hypothetical protein DSO57_1019648 [Entomophthora muscae]|uniref:Uncharacterized protein n=1 Tax=Entomophthora muscae TaxID=34485 RepID=A0ACC2UDR7_9FUNG|nr:hypothetical protein DSO57_1019648 [Entomophthora muscae]
MLVTLAKFVIFTLAPALFLIWSTSPELWTCISSLAYLAVENPSSLLHLLDNLPGKASNLLFTGETLVFSLTCGNVNFSLPAETPMCHLYEDSHMPASVEFLCYLGAFPGSFWACV